MTVGPQLDPEDGSLRHRPASRARLARYGFAALASLVAFVTMLVFVPLIDEPLYAILVGAVAVTVWYGGFGPALLGVGIGWSLCYLVFVGEPEYLDSGTDEDILRWGSSVIVGLGVVWVSVVLHRGRERAAIAAEEARGVGPRDDGAPGAGDGAVRRGDADRRRPRARRADAGAARRPRRRTRARRRRRARHRRPPERRSARRTSRAFGSPSGRARRSHRRPRPGRPFACWIARPSSASIRTAQP